MIDCCNGDPPMRTTLGWRRARLRVGFGPRGVSAFIVLSDGHPYKRRATQRHQELFLAKLLQAQHLHAARPHNLGGVRGAAEGATPLRSNRLLHGGFAVDFRALDLGTMLANIAATTNMLEIEGAMVGGWLKPPPANLWKRPLTWRLQPMCWRLYRGRGVCWPPSEIRKPDLGLPLAGSNM